MNDTTIKPKTSMQSFIDDECDNSGQFKRKSAFQHTQSDKRPKTNCSHPDVRCFQCKKENQNKGRWFKTCKVCQQFLEWVDDPETAPETVTLSPAPDENGQKCKNCGAVIDEDLINHFNELKQNIQSFIDYFKNKK